METYGEYLMKIRVGLLGTCVFNVSTINYKKFHTVIILLGMENEYFSSVAIYTKIRM